MRLILFVFGFVLSFSLCAEEQFEFGTVDLSVADNWFEVETKNEYINPVVVTGGISTNDEDGVVSRVRNVTSGSFEVRLEDRGTSGLHTGVETVSFMVVEEGEHLIGGLRFVARKKNDFDPAGYSVGGASSQTEYQSLVVTDSPIINQADAVGAWNIVPFSQLVGEADESPMSIRLNVDSSVTDRIRFRFEQARGDQSLVFVDEVHFVAIQAGRGETELGLPIQAATTNRNDQPITHVFSDIFFDPSETYLNPILFCQLPRVYGGNSAAARYRDLSENGVQFKADEPTGWDQNHGPEVVSYFIIGVPAFEVVSIAAHELSVSSNAEILGNLSVGSNFDVLGDSSFSGSLDLGGDLVVSGQLLNSDGTRITNLGSDENENILIGTGASAESSLNIVIGGNASFFSPTDASAVGVANVVVGPGSRALDSAGTAIGILTTAGNKQATAVGAFSESFGSKSIALGTSSSSGGFASIAIGNSVFASGDESISIGRSSGAEGDRGIAIGRWSSADGKEAIAIGTGVGTADANAILLGNHLRASGENSTVIGSYNSQNPQNHNFAEEAFAIGIGTSDESRRTPFVILDDGAIIIERQGDISMGVFGGSQ